MAVVDTTLTESIRLVPVDVVVRAQPALSLDELRIQDVMEPFYGVVMREQLAIREQLLGNQTANITATDAMVIFSALYRASIIEAVEGIGIQQGHTLQRGAAIVEALKLSSALAGGAIYQLSVTQTFRLATALGNFFGADVIEALGLGEASLGKLLAAAKVVDDIQVEGVVAPQFLLNVVAGDELVIEAADAVRMLFSPTISEGIELTAGYIAPNGSFTTWAMNTRTGAVTEYGDFVFESFAKMGSKYLGASDTGLYELLGDTDNGTQIIARIRGGYMQFGGTHLSRLKEAYIAARGGGDFVLQIRTADGERYNYGVEARSMRSTKVHMGKGMRARYFAFELVSAGQDFDLDTLEFVPLVVQRRV